MNSMKFKETPRRDLTLLAAMILMIRGGATIVGEEWVAGGAVPLMVVGGMPLVMVGRRAANQQHEARSSFVEE